MWIKMWLNEYDNKVIKNVIKNDPWSSKVDLDLKKSPDLYWSKCYLDW